MTRIFLFLTFACVLAVLVWQVRAVAPGHDLRDWIDVWATYRLEAIPVSPEPHIVQPGETIWDIARAYRLPGDLRMTVDIIRELNSLWGPDSPILRPGQRLKVPEPDREQWPLAMQHAWR